MTPQNISLNRPDSAQADPKSADSRKVESAARDFETLLLAQMLRSAREGASAWGGSDSDGTTDSIMEMAEQQIANALSSAGGLGLSNLVVQGLQKPAADPTSRERHPTQVSGEYSASS